MKTSRNVQMQYDNIYQNSCLTNFCPRLRDSATRLFIKKFAHCLDTVHGHMQTQWQMRVQPNAKAGNKPRKIKVLKVNANTKSLQAN